MRTLVTRVMTILGLLSAFATAEAREYAEFGPCTCIWDNTTKDYPPNPKTVGYFSTTVRYSCGYICLDGEGKIQHVIGQHEASYSGQEAGNEVICDGMLYEPHENPTGSYNRWLLYFWDGITHPVNARTSTSPTLREWARNSCGSAQPTPSSRAMVGLAQIDQMRVTLGMHRVKGEPTIKIAKVEKLGPELTKACVLSDAQKSFSQGQTHESLKETCSSPSDEQAKRFEDLRLRSLRLHSVDEAIALAREANSLLLCPNFTNTPTAAILRNMLEKTTSLASSSDRSELAELTCTMGLRGLRWPLIPENAKSLLAL